MARSRLVDEYEVLSVNYPIVLGATVSGYVVDNNGYLPGTTTLSGTAPIKYEISKFDNNGNNKLTINYQRVNTQKAVTNFSPDLPLDVRNSITNSMHIMEGYDTRAMKYMIGRELIRGVESNNKLIELCDIHPVTHRTLDIGYQEFIYSPPQFYQGVCVTVLAMLAKACGKERIFIALEETKRFIVQLITQQSYVIGLVTLANQFLMDAKMAGMFGQALFALARGVSSVYRLHAHSDAGGYTMNACREADYPES